jgi:hypothetical protein
VEHFQVEHCLVSHNNDFIIPSNLFIIYHRSYRNFAFWINIRYDRKLDNSQKWTRLKTHINDMKEVWWCSMCWVFLFEGETERKFIFHYHLKIPLSSCFQWNLNLYDLDSFCFIFNQFHWYDWSSSNVISFSFNILDQSHLWFRKFRESSNEFENDLVIPK